MEKVSLRDRGVVVQINIKGVKIKNVLLDGGSAVNLMSEKAYQQLGQIKIIPTPFNLLMVDQSSCHPLGYIPSLPMLISGIRYFIDCVVLRERDSSNRQPMLLGRPWLTQAKVKHNGDEEKKYII